jgi:hypothetical protein
MKAMKSALIAASAVALMAVLSAGPAAAAAINFTWDPGLSVGPLSTATPPASTAFTADDINIADYATINLTNPSVVTENALLAVTGFNTGVAPAGFVGGNGSGAGNAGATPYQLYFLVTSTSHVTPAGPGILLGSFDTLSYQLIGDVGGNCQFSIAGAACGSDTQLVLATGSLSDNGVNQANILNGIPSANADASIATGANTGGFFVSPSDLASIDFETSFTNTGGVIATNGPIITINGGGGNVDIVVPEPLTLSLFGAGLLGMGAMRRRRSKKA